MIPSCKQNINDTYFTLNEHIEGLLTFEALLFTQLDEDINAHLGNKRHLTPKY